MTMLQWVWVMGKVMGVISGPRRSSLTRWRVTGSCLSMGRVEAELCHGGQSTLRASCTGRRRGLVHV